MQTERIARIATLALLGSALAACAYGRIDRVPEAMIAQPEEDRDLVAAILTGDTVHADHLLSTGADPDQRGSGGATPLIAAAMTDATALAARLLDLGADSRPVDDVGKNALAYALERDNAELVALLVENARRTY